MVSTLKQSPRAWFEKFTTVVKAQGYKQCQTEHILFVKSTSDRRLAILIWNVNDIVIIGDYIDAIAWLRKSLAIEFEVKNLNNLRYFFGMEVARTKEGICIF